MSLQSLTTEVFLQSLTTFFLICKLILLSDAIPIEFKPPK